MKLTGGEIILKQIVKEGVPYILGIPGHGALALFDAIRKEDKAGNIKYIQVKHEQTAAAIADGYFRIAGKPLATFASIGPGTLNFSIGLGNAYVDSTAFLALCGDTHTHMRGVGVLQEVDRYQDSNIIRALEPLAKRSWRAESVKTLPRMIRRAFDVMTSGRPGPCVITLPMDVQAQSCDAPLAEKSKDPSETLPRASASQVDKAIELMKTAKRPVIIAGGGALYSQAGELVTKLAEKWGAAIITTLAAKGTVAETHPQYCFHTGSKGTVPGLEVTRKADVILALGCRFADETSCSYRKGAGFNFPDTKLIHVDIDASEIGKNYLADVGIVGDVKETINAILAKKPTFTVCEKYLKELVVLREAWLKSLKDKRLEKVKDGRLSISQLIGIMNETLSEDTIISTSSGNTQAQLFQEYCYKKPYCNLTTGGFSTMGWAFPAAIGAKLAAPKRPVVALMGDGDFQMTMQELSTVAQENIPVVIILADNSGWFAIKDLQIDVFGDAFAFGNDFERDGKPYSPNFAAIAEAFGIKSYRVNDEKSVKEALAEAVEQSLKNKKPALLHIDVSRVHPYSGGKACGWWDVPIPTYMAEKRKVYEESITEEQV